MTTRAGFTLLEMLVALVVFGLLMAGLTQTTHFALSAWRADTRNADGPARLSAADAALRQMIEQAAPQNFAGAANHLAFTTTLPAGSLLTGRADAAILLAPGQTLILRYAPQPAGLPFGPPPPPRTEALLPDVAAIRFSYLAPQPPGPPVWVSAWRRAGLPLLVRIGIRLDTGRSPPDVLAAPAIAAP